MATMFTATNYTLFFSTIPKKPTFIKPSLLSTLSISNTSIQSPPNVCENSPTNFNTHILPIIPKQPTSAYVHLPFCRKRCHYCDFPIVALGSSPPKIQNQHDPRIIDYIQLIRREIEATKTPEPSPDKTLKTVFFGGGTPSLVPPILISSILETLRNKFGFASNLEISIEMDPGTFDPSSLRELMNVGVNRVSLGVQAFQEEMLRACGRAHGIDEVHESIEIVQSSGLVNWSLDLISSLPHQTMQLWEQSLELAIQAGPAHVSVYDLQVEQGTKFGIWYSPGEFPLPSESQSADFYKTASTILSEAGYNHYEISNYCKNGFECKHNLTYWHKQSFYAFGLGSASYVGGVRFSRPRRMKEYMGYVQRLEDGEVEHHDHGDAKDVAMDVVMLSLRLARGLDVRLFGRTFGKSLALSLCRAFKPYVESRHVVAFDDERGAISSDEYCSILSENYDVEGGMIAFIRLSDPNGFLLSNELISVAFAVISP